MKSLKVEGEREREVQTKYIVGKKSTNKEWVRKENRCGREKAIKDEFGENNFSISLITKEKHLYKLVLNPLKQSN